MRILVESSTPHHRKIRRLAKEMGVGPATALGWYVALLCRVIEECPDGLLREWPDSEVSRACLYRGSAVRLCRALTGSEILDREGKWYRVRNFVERQGDIILKRAKDRERKRAVRAESARSPKDTEDVSAPPLRSVPLLASPNPASDVGSTRTDEDPKDEMARHLAQVYASQKGAATAQALARTKIRAALERKVPGRELEVAIWSMAGHEIWDVIRSVENPNGRAKEPGAPAPPPVEPYPETL